MNISKNKQIIVSAIPKDAPYCNWSKVDPCSFFAFNRPIINPTKKDIIKITIPSF